MLFFRNISSGGLIGRSAIGWGWILTRHFFHTQKRRMDLRWRIRTRAFANSGLSTALRPETLAQQSERRWGGLASRMYGFPTGGRTLRRIGKGHEKGWRHHSTQFSKSRFPRRLIWIQSSPSYLGLVRRVTLLARMSFMSVTRLRGRSC